MLLSFWLFGQVVVPAAILHLVLEGAYLVLVTAAVVTPTPLRQDGWLAGSEAGAAGSSAEEASYLWLAPVLGGLLMGFAASAEVLGCCCSAPAQTQLTYAVAVIAAISCGAIDLADHVSSLRYCGANPTAAWCGGADTALAESEAAVAEDGATPPPADPVVEWLDHSSGDASVGARWVVTAFVIALILARCAALVNGCRSRNTGSICGNAGTYHKAPPSGSDLNRTNTGTPIAIRQSADEAALTLTQSAAMQDPAAWNDHADMTPRAKGDNFQF